MAAPLFLHNQIPKRCSRVNVTWESSTLLWLLLTMKIPKVCRVSRSNRFYSGSLKNTCTCFQGHMKLFGTPLVTNVLNMALTWLSFQIIFTFCYLCTFKDQCRTIRSCVLWDDDCIKDRKEWNHSLLGQKIHCCVPRNWGFNPARTWAAHLVLSTPKHPRTL